MSNHYDCFISYGRANSKEFAKKLTQRLQEESLAIWFDQHDIPPAVDWQEQINDGMGLKERIISCLLSLLIRLNLNIV